MNWLKGFILWPVRIVSRFTRREEEVVQKVSDIEDDGRMHRIRMRMIHMLGRR